MENWEDQSLVFPAPLNRPAAVATWSLKFFSCGKFIIPLDQNNYGKVTSSEQTGRDDGSAAGRVGRTRT